jgi:hypothetical protein
MLLISCGSALTTFGFSLRLQSSKESYGIAVLANVLPSFLRELSGLGYEEERLRCELQHPQRQ